MSSPGLRSPKHCKNSHSVASPEPEVDVTFKLGVASIPKAMNPKAEVALFVAFPLPCCHRAEAFHFRESRPDFSPAVVAQIGTSEIASVADASLETIC